MTYANRQLLKWVVGAIAAGLALGYLLDRFTP